MNIDLNYVKITIMFMVMLGTVAHVKQCYMNWFILQLFLWCLIYHSLENISFSERQTVAPWPRNCNSNRQKVVDVILFCIQLILKWIYSV